jgi:hypothetical protein
MVYAALPAANPQRESTLLAEDSSRQGTRLQARRNLIGGPNFRATLRSKLGQTAPSAGREPLEPAEEGGRGLTAAREPCHTDGLN